MTGVISTEVYFNLLGEHQALVDQLGMRDDLIRVLRTRGNTQLGVINRQAQAIARVLQLVDGKHLVRTDEIIRALEGAQ